MLHPLFFVVISGLAEPESLTLKDLLLSSEFHHLLHHLTTVHINHCCSVWVVIYAYFVILCIESRLILFTWLLTKAWPRRPLKLTVTCKDCSFVYLYVLQHVFLVGYSHLAALPPNKLNWMNRHRGARRRFDEIRSYQVTNDPIFIFSSILGLPYHRTRADVDHQMRGHGDLCLFNDYGGAVVLQLFLVVMYRITAFIA